MILDTQPVRRGAQVFGRDLQLWLLKNGHECARLYLYAAVEAEILPLYDMDGVLGGRAGHWRERVLSVDPQVLAHAARRIKAYLPDLVLLNGSSTGRYGMWLRHCVSKETSWVKRVIGDVSYGLSHMPMAKRSLHRMVGTVGAGRLDGVVAVGKHALDRFREAYRYQGGAVVIPRAIDDQYFFSPDGYKGKLRADLAEPDVKILMFVGNLSREKRPDRFIRVFSAVRKRFSRARAWVVGDGPLRTTCEDLATELNVRSQVDFFGYRADIRPYLADADVLFLSSDTEGVPGAALEAACMGLPIVATRVGDVDMCVQDGATGYLVDRQDEQAASGAVGSLFNDSDLARRLGNNGRKFVKSHFSMQEIDRQYEWYFNSVMAKSRKM